MIIMRNYKPNVNTKGFNLMLKINMEFVNFYFNVQKNILKQITKKKKKQINI